MNRSPSHEYSTEEVQRVRTDFVRAELDVAHTFLDIAVNTRDRSQAQKHIYTAIDALQSADRFFLQAQSNTSENRDIRERREELRQRLSEMTTEAQR